MRSQLLSIYVYGTALTFDRPFLQPMNTNGSIPELRKRLQAARDRMLQLQQELLELRNTMQELRHDLQKARGKLKNKKPE